MVQIPVDGVGGVAGVGAGEMGYYTAEASLQRLRGQVYLQTLGEGSEGTLSAGVAVGRAPVIEEARRFYDVHVENARLIGRGDDTNLGFWGHGTSSWQMAPGYSGAS